MLSNLLTEFEGPAIDKVDRKLDPVGAAIGRRTNPESFIELLLTSLPVKGASFALEARCHDIVTEDGKPIEPEKVQELIDHKLHEDL